MCEKLAKILIAYKQYTKKITVEMEYTLKELYKNFLEKYSEIDFFRFHYYLPLYNDGSACVNTFSGIEVLLKENNKFSKETDVWDDEFSLKKYLKDYTSLIEDLKELNDSLEKSAYFLENIYGINCIITINREKINIEEYDCGF